jgi:replicative DNA helicase
MLEPSRNGARPGRRDARLEARRASQIPVRNVEWYWRGWLPKGRLVVVSGRPGDGKTAVVLDVLARLTTGDELPDGQMAVEPVTIGILSAEDDASDTLVPRLMAARADLDRCIILGNVTESRAEAFLTELLADGPVAATMCEEKAATAGIRGDTQASQEVSRSSDSQTAGCIWIVVLVS